MISRTTPHSIDLQFLRGSWLGVAVAWILVLFYLVASGRALLPGLCATQAALEAQQRGDAPSVAPATPACCAVRDTDGQPCDDKSRPVTPSDSHCAFCNLLIAHTDPPLGVCLPAPVAPAFQDTVPLAVQVASTDPRGAAPNRAPPA